MAADKTGRAAPGATCRSVHGFWEPRRGDADGKRHPNECAPYLHAIERHKKIGRGA